MGFGRLPLDTFQNQLPAEKDYTADVQIHSQSDSREFFHPSVFCLSSVFRV